MKIGMPSSTKARLAYNVAVTIEQFYATFITKQLGTEV